MIIHVDSNRVKVHRDEKIFGHFLEHFHTQVYGAIYDPASRFADEDGFRKDTIEALKKIKPPIIRWPGGCFVSSYDWKKGVGKRIPAFDKAWRVEDSNEFGTDEFIKLCEKLSCKPYICTNAGTGTAEAMSDWLEYCNLENEGQWAKLRIENGHIQPYNVPYWSIGNENYGAWEIGAKEAHEWGRLVLEASKMMKRVDPRVQLSAASLTNVQWNINVLSNAGYLLDWISIHEYWDGLWENHTPASYEACMAFTQTTEKAIKKITGILTALGLENKISIAFDEWNLRSWHHPNIHHNFNYVEKKDYLTPRDENDNNQLITMADAVFSACFLNGCLRNAHIVKMANFAAMVNTRGVIAVNSDGIVKRSTFHVFDLYVNYTYDQVIDCYSNDLYRFDVIGKDGKPATVCTIDMVATKSSETGEIALAIVNKHPDESVSISVKLQSLHMGSLCEQHFIKGSSKDDYNDMDRDNIHIESNACPVVRPGILDITLSPHSVNVVHIA